MGRAASDDSVFLAIASPTRRALLDALVPGESSVSELVDALDVTQSAVSQQLAVLKSAGLVGERSEGRFRYYCLRPGPLDEISAWVARTRAFHEKQLDALGRVLDALPDEEKKGARRPRGRRTR
jgi:DNA-binding transcriptional ArsR family regulator